jgi:fermentation-respiration switch protein FrsA (DUF1100 family)
VLKKVGLALIILYLGCGVLINTPLYTFCVLSPSKKVEPARFEAITGADKQKLRIPSQGEKLQAWFFPVKSSNFLAIVHHGRGGNLYNKTFLAQQLIDRHLSVLVYDYCGYGESTGTAKLSTFIPDALAVYDFAVNELHYQPARIINVGESIGTGPACAIAEKRQCAGIFLQAPFTSLPMEAKASFPMLHVYPDWLFPDPKFENIEYVKKRHPPLLIIHGAKDRQIPVAHSQLLFDVASEPKSLVILPNAGHRNVGGADPEVFGKALTEFLNRIIK